MPRDAVAGETKLEVEAEDGLLNRLMRMILMMLTAEEELKEESWRAARQRERWTSPRRGEGSSPSPSPSPFGGAVIYAMGRKHGAG
jgi:hypothetical protein